MRVGRAISRAQPPEVQEEGRQDFPTVPVVPNQLAFLISSINSESPFALVVPVPLQIDARFAFLVSISAKGYSC